METPKFKHDCDECTFLGKDIDESRTEYDVYFCPQNGIPTIILRYSSEPWEYASTPIIVINSSLETFSKTPFLRNMLIAEDRQLFNRQLIFGDSK